MTNLDKCRKAIATYSKCLSDGTSDMYEIKDQMNQLIVYICDTIAESKSITPCPSIYARECVEHLRSNGLLSDYGNDVYDFFCDFDIIDEPNFEQALQTAEIVTAAVIEWVVMEFAEDFLNIEEPEEKHRHNHVGEAVAGVGITATVLSLVIALCKRK
ncbi:MAG: hypothetical protein NC548_10760 [Lachnospiraceae bacterium]|nr:hypothetical protein [Lachnospiraceae bacterium]